MDKPFVKLVLFGLLFLYPTLISCISSTVVGNTLSSNDTSYWTFYPAYSNCGDLVNVATMSCTNCFSTLLVSFNLTQLPNFYRTTPINGITISIPGLSKSAQVGITNINLEASGYLGQPKNLGGCSDPFSDRGSVKTAGSASDTWGFAANNFVGSNFMNVNVNVLFTTCSDESLYLDCISMTVDYPIISTTAEQTTGERTTAERTTSERTTGEQTTGERTTGEQTTGEQTTSEQTTGQQTTQFDPSNAAIAEKKKKSSAGAIVAGILVPLICICVILAIIIFILLRKKRKEKQNEGGQVIALQARSKSSEKVQEESHYTTIPQVDDSVESRSIHVSKLRSYVESLLLTINDNSPVVLFQSEYNKMNNMSSKFEFQYHAATQQINVVKNRYHNVLAPDNSRVVLKGEGGGSDYINANFLSGLVPGSEKQYIATQGPLANTVGDFWRMVWEHRVSVVVMLTREFENGALKCSKYWVEKGEFVDLQNGLKLFCRNEPEVKPSGITIREMELSDSLKTIKVNLIQYNSWPDHGLPQNTASFLDTIHLSDDLNFTKGPLVVHCSAGIGRTGTWCAIHSNLHKLRFEMRQGNQDPQVNLMQTILNFRRLRPGMVQTEDQYIFAWMALLDQVEELFEPTKKPSKIITDDPASPYVRFSQLVSSHEN